MTQQEAGRATTSPRCPLLLRLDQFLDLLAELRGVLMAVHRHSVLDRRVDELLLAVGRDRHGAVHLARVVAAVDKVPCHLRLPVWRTIQRRRFADANRGTSRPGETCRARRYCDLATAFAFSPARRRTVSTSRLNPAGSTCTPLSTVLQWRTMAAIAIVSRISSSVAPFALAAAVWK